jgi:hypothetical protein
MNIMYIVDKEVRMTVCILTSSRSENALLMGSVWSVGTARWRWASEVNPQERPIADLLSTTTS